MATFFWDSGDYSIGAWPSGWVDHGETDTDQFSWDIVDLSGANVGEGFCDGTDVSVHRWDDEPPASPSGNLQAYGRIRQNETNRVKGVGLINTSGQGYVAGLEDGIIKLWRTDDYIANSDYVEVATDSPAPVGADSWVEIRLEWQTDGTLQVRAWVDGATEPGTWDISSSDGTFTPTHPAFVTHRSQQFNLLGFGTGGDAAPTSSAVSPHAFFDVTDLPADFGNAETAEIVVRTRGVDIGATPLKLYAQLFESDETTTLSDEVEVAEETTNSSFTNSSPVTFTGLNTTAAKSVWDNARVRFRWSTT